MLKQDQHPSPDDLFFELPLRPGKLFGRDPTARHDIFYAWLVESVGPIPPAIRALRPGLADSLYSLVYRTNPDRTTVDFVPGLGVARYRYSHHGTISEVDAWLVGFHEGTP